MIENSSEFPYVPSCIDGKILFDPGKRNTVADIVIVVFNIITCLFGTFANSLVIMSYYRNPPLRTIQNTIFFLLAITDFHVTSFAQPLYVFTIIRGLQGQRECLYWDIISISTWLFLGLSLMTTSVLTFQTYISLAYPFRFKTIITKTRLMIGVGISWSVISISTMKSIIFSHVSVAYYICSALILFTILAVILTWIWTYKLVARHRREIQSTQTQETRNFTTQRTVLRSTVTALLITLSLLGCFCFPLLMMFRRMIGFWKMNDSTYSILYMSKWTSMYLNSLFNPYLIFWRSSDFRKAAKKILIS